MREGKGTTATDTRPVGMRRWIARLSFVVLGPLLALLLAESLLRAFHYGVPADFFLPDRVKDQHVWTDSPSYTQPIFGPGLARNPWPFVVPREKSPDTLRVFVLGESAALGDPIPEFSFSRQLEAMLQTALPGRRIEVINTAVTAINSPVIRHIARDCARRQPDVFVIYMGNNEVVGPFGPGTVFSRALQSPRILHAAMALRRTRINQVLQTAVARLQPPRRWAGMEMFLRQTVPANDARLPAVYSNFEAHVQEVVQLGRQAGARVVLCTVAANVRDCAPLASLPRPGFPEADLARLASLVTNSLQSSLNANYTTALMQADAALGLDDHYAAAHFVRARALQGVGDLPAAQSAYARALETDVLRFRADSAINAAIRAVAARTADDGVRLADVEALFRRAAPDGLPGDDFFHDHVHLTFEAQHRVAALIFEQLQAQDVVPDGALPLTLEQTAEALGWTVWTSFQTEEEMYVRRLAPPFSQQVDHTQTAERFAERLLTRKESLSPEDVRETVRRCEAAVARHPDDPVRWTLLGEARLELGEAKSAALAHGRAADLLPHHAKPRLAQALALALDGRAREGVALLRQPRDQAFSALADELVNVGRSDLARPLFQDAWRLNPRNHSALVNLGTAKAVEGDPAGALVLLKEAVKAAPRDDVARANLGLALLQVGQKAAGLAELQESVRLNPQNADSQNALAVVLQQTNRLTEARTHFQAALMVRPLDSLVLVNAAGLEERSGRLDAAQSLLERAVRASPDSVDLRRQAGSLGMRRGQWEEARRHYEILAVRPDASAEDAYRLGLCFAQMTNYPAARTVLEQALTKAPAYAPAHFSLAQVLYREGRVVESLPHYRTACTLQPNQILWRRDLAWLLATHPDPSVRNPEEALTWAQPLVAPPRAPEWQDWDVMGAVQATSANFVQAVGCISNALELVSREEDRLRLRDRLLLFQSGRPFLDKP